MFVWTIRDVIGVIALGLLGGIFVVDWIYNKYRERRRK